jgi:succinyl-CoA synthetase alpha subunit
MANEFVGSALIATWVTTSATIQLDTDARNFNYSPTIAFIDATAGADQNVQRVNSFKDGQITCDMLMLNNVASATIAAFDEGTGGSVIFAPAGTAAGKLKYTVPSICMGVTQSVPYNDVVTMSVTWQQNGVRALGTY